MTHVHAEAARSTNSAADVKLKKEIKANALGPEKVLVQVAL